MLGLSDARGPASVAQTLYRETKPAARRARKRRRNAGRRGSSRYCRRVGRRSGPAQDYSVSRTRVDFLLAFLYYQLVVGRYRWSFQGLSAADD